ncbi:hypothetical protein BS47DRAFT_1368069 [Hydnum rufescens UP504]|uniref:Uncharacterized protein n=1 Tax=Hydnum rufescens UP504 TaxID=1448309 RepID=A0A9P6DNN9_9AGAM|nr:hypothetical protein BS47DRAFT_1368069 [Hydnum rufescens UP504]
MHHEIQECAATQDPDSRVPTTHTTTKRVRCHTPALAGFLTLRNPHPKNPRTRLGRNTGVCAATQDLNPRVSPTPTMTNQVRRHTPTSVLSPSTKPNPENAQTTHHETQECAATQDPDSRVPTTHTMAKQVRCHTPTSADFLTPQNPHPKNPRARPGRNTGMHAATQDPNSRLFATNTMRRPQIRSHTPAEAGPLSLCTTPPEECHPRPQP